MSSDDDGVSFDPNVSLVTVDASVEGASDEDDVSVEGASDSVDDVSVEGASDSLDDVSVEGASDSGFVSELELLNIEPIGSNPNMPEDEDDDEEDDESSVILDTLSGLDFFVCDFLLFPLFFLEAGLLHAERQ